MSTTPRPTAALLADARNVLAYSSDPHALSAARLVVARAESAPECLGHPYCHGNGSPAEHVPACPLFTGGRTAQDARDFADGLAGHECGVTP